MPEFYILHDTTPPTRPHVKGPILRPSPLQVSSISVIVQITFWRGGKSHLALCLQPPHTNAWFPLPVYRAGGH